MFLISKIVRGRRLLNELQHELQQEEETKKMSVHEKAEHQLFRNRQYSMQNTEFQEGQDQDDALMRNRVASQRRKKTTRQKTDSSLPFDEDTNNALEVPNRMRRTSSMPSVSDCPTPHKISIQTRVRHYNYNARLNKLQKRSLRFTWQRLQTRNGGKKIEDVFAEVFEKLMRQVPLLRDIFTTRAFLSAMSRNDVATVRDHARTVVKMFDMIIKNLDIEENKRTDTSNELDPRLLGRAHGCLKPYKFTANIWEILGETIIDVVLSQEAVRDLPGAGQAWVVLTACVVDQLRAGFEMSRESYGISAQPAPTCSNARSIEENYSQDRNYLLSSPREKCPSRHPSMDQHASFEENHHETHLNTNNHFSNQDRRNSRRLTRENVHEEDSFEENPYRQKYSSNSDRPVPCSRLSSRSSSSTKSQPPLRQSGF